jgi:hypothetical protein
VPAAGFDLLHCLGEIAAFRRLHRRERFQRLEPLEPQLLADRQPFICHLSVNEREDRSPAPAEGGVIVVGR